MTPYQLSAAETLSELRSSLQGLTSEEAQTRLKTHGPNELVEKKKKTFLMMFLDQFKDFMILVLIVAAVISGVIGEPVDTAAIIVIVLLNAVLGFTQEFRAEKAMDALKKMAASLADVIRDNIAGPSLHRNWCPAISWYSMRAGSYPPTCGSSSPPSSGSRRPPLPGSPYPWRRPRPRSQGMRFPLETGRTCSTRARS